MLSHEFIEKNWRLFTNGDSNITKTMVMNAANILQSQGEYVTTDPIEKVLRSYMDPAGIIKEDPDRFPTRRIREFLESPKGQRLRKELLAIIELLKTDPDGPNDIIIPKEGNPYAERLRSCTS